jgi:general stress protein YciG
MAKRGFAALKESNPKRLREIAALGGAATKAENRSFFKDPDLASAAGRKGGMASRGGGRKAR